MDIAALENLPDTDAIRLEARRLGLEKYLLEMHTYGVTIIPPETVGSPELIERLRDGILRVLAERHDIEVPEDWRTHSEPWGGPKVWCWLFEDEAFIEAILHPVALCLAHFMCGRNAVLQGTPAIIKTQGTASRTNEEGYMRLHTDTHGVPSPLPEWAQVVNISWLLTDYEGPEDGPTVLVPGSHRFGRMPRADEAEWWLDGAPVEPISLTGKAGSLAVWHGSLWHGSRPRSTDGMRITLPTIYGRSYMQPIHTWTEAVAVGDNQKLVEKYPQLVDVLGLWHPYPTDRDGPAVPQQQEGTMRMIGVGDNIYA
ncbi:MAG: phytanoyl-CoA dioxygenase family protein [Gammaproteobacteria bacterium]|nr:phytanoyl-CoA dioxygenase family protein [Gammaproteobacteria bacterium]